MIEKLDHADIVSREIIVSKLNELIEEHNQLVNDYVDHYHTALDTKYHTTGPKAGGPEGD